jgi:hypothetical protein
MKFTKPFFKIILLSFVISYFLLFMVCGEEKPVNPYNANLVFYQIDYDLDGQITKDSSNGSVVLTFDTSSDILYFNLVVDDNWVIQNIPAISYEWEGDRQSRFITFDLGVDEGNNITEFEYAFSLTKDIITVKQDKFQTVNVGDYNVIFYSGLPEEPIFNFKFNTMVGGIVKDYSLQDEKFPNQQCEKNECVPTAVSNSLKYLNNMYNLGLTDDQMSIATMKKATRWNNGCGDDWWSIKDGYMKSNNYPINTEKIEGDQTTMFDRAKTAIEEGKDVEMCLSGHCVAVVGITKTGEYTYSVDIAHDNQQGVGPGEDEKKCPNGGTVIETITYDSRTNKFTGGGKYINGKKFKFFVVESKE